jgi:hypothetical protein
MVCLNRYINSPQLGESLSLSASWYRDFTETGSVYLSNRHSLFVTNTYKKSGIIVFK